MVKRDGRKTRHAIIRMDEEVLNRKRDIQDLLTKDMQKQIVELIRH